MSSSARGSSLHFTARDCQGDLVPPVTQAHQYNLLPAASLPSSNFELPRLLPAMASLDAARRRRRRRPLLLIGLACTTRALAPTETRRWQSLRRTAGCAALAVAAPIAPAFAALNPNLGTLDPNGPNQGVVIGLDEDAPFRAAASALMLLCRQGRGGTVAVVVVVVAWVHVGLP